MRAEIKAILFAPSRETSAARGSKDERALKPRGTATFTSKL
jgi:hypothetical protein